MVDQLFDGAIQRARLLALFVGSIWAVSLANTLLGLGLGRYGILPREATGLVGFLTAPWLHAGFWHLVSNTGGLLILGWLCMWPRVSAFWTATAGAMLGAGLTAWLFGESNTSHVGASGVVFGYAGYLVARGWYSRQLLALLVALFVAGTYGLSMLMGLLPLYPGVSWQSHLGGAVGGVLTAKWLVAATRSPEVRHA